MRSPDTPSLEQIAYRPPRGYRLDLEVMPISELRRRGSAAHFRRSQRLAQYQIVVALNGHCTHMVDFVPQPCAHRTWLLVRPGQVQRFDFSRDWQGWLLVFRPEFLLPPQGTRQIDELTVAGHLENLSVRLELAAQDHETALAVLLQMHRDTQRDAEPADLNSLLRHQLYVLLGRLHLAQPHTESLPGWELQRFSRFRQTVEERFRQTHRLGDIARQLGYSEKTINRACQRIAGISAKAWLSRRIGLEARRMLVHTVWPVKAIAADLGFNEATNFVKFFKRECGCSPGAFRKAHPEGLGQNPEARSPNMLRHGR